MGGKSGHAPVLLYGIVTAIEAWIGDRRDDARVALESVWCTLEAFGSCGTAGMEGTERQRRRGFLQVRLPDSRRVVFVDERDPRALGTRSRGGDAIAQAINRQRRDAEAARRFSAIVPVAVHQERDRKWRDTHALAAGLTALRARPCYSVVEEAALRELVDEGIELARVLGSDQLLAHVSGLQREIVTIDAVRGLEAQLIEECLKLAERFGITVPLTRALLPFCDASSTEEDQSDGDSASADQSTGVVEVPIKRARTVTTLDSAVRTAARRCWPLSNVTGVRKAFRIALRERAKGLSEDLARDANPDTQLGQRVSWEDRQRELDRDDSDHEHDDSDDEHDALSLGEPRSDSANAQCSSTYDVPGQLTASWNDQLGAQAAPARDPRTIQRRKKNLQRTRAKARVDELLASPDIIAVPHDDVDGLALHEAQGFEIVDTVVVNGRWCWMLRRSSADSGNSPDVKQQQPSTANDEAALRVFDLEKSARRDLTREIAKARKVSPDSAARTLRRWLENPQQYATCIPGPCREAFAQFVDICARRKCGRA